MAAPPLPREVQQLREKLLVDQAPSARARTDYFDPTRFAARFGRPYSSRRLSIDTMMEMRTDAILRFAQLVSLISLFTAKWRIECASARKAQFIDHALRRVIGRLLLQFYQSWNFGWQAIVKEFGLMSPNWEFLDVNAEGGPKSSLVWDGGPEVPALVWEPFVPLPPAMVAPVWTSGGAFNGIALAKTGALNPGGYGFPTVPMNEGDFIGLPSDVLSYFTGDDDQQRTLKVDVQNSLWVVNERDDQWGSIWGNSRLSYAYKYWWAYEMTLGILNRSVERKGDPTIIVAYPSGSSRVNGADVDNQTIAFSIAQKARSGAVLAVPSEVWGEDTATANQAPKWSVSTLKYEADFEQLLKVLEYFDTMKFRAMMVSELSIAEGSGGTSSRNVAAETGQRTSEAQVITQVEWDEIINRYMIPQLADANFPELKDEPARKVTQAFGENEATLAADLLRSIANANPDSLPVDKSSLLGRFQIDALQGEQLAKWERDMAAKAEQSQPPEVPAQPGGAAGTVDTGFGVLYYDAPERIELDDDETLLASLPATKHYSDRAVLAQTRLVRKLWKELLTDQYEHFASQLESGNLDLAQRDRKFDQRAQRIVRGWSYGGKAAAKIKRIAAALAVVFARAGALELAASNLSANNWDPSDKQLVEWMRNQTASMVRSIDETTRKQLSTYLAAQLQADASVKQIADGVRKHFSEFPAWRADLIAREETKHFYNAATLFAAEKAGVEQVQALDAQKGPTDAECEHRNGRLFSIEDAWAESSREHIRGTLSWRIVPAGIRLSLTYVSEEEAGGVAARFDPEERAIHLVKGLDPAEEGRYLEQLVRWYIATH